MRATCFIDDVGRNDDESAECLIKNRHIIHEFNKVENRLNEALLFADIFDDRGSSRRSQRQIINF